MVERLHVGLVTVPPIGRVRNLLLFGALAAIAVAIIAAAGTASGVTETPLAAGKQAVADHIASVRASAAANPAPKIPINPNTDSSSSAIFAPLGGTPAGVGLLFGHADTARPPTDKDDSFTNSWSIFSSSLNLDVWAGARGADAEQGFVMVVIWNADRTSIVGGGSFDTPSRSGAVSIVSANGQVLTLATDATASSSATTFVFDTASLQFK